PDERVFDVFAAQVHVRREGVERDRFLDRHFAADLPVVHVGWDIGNAAAHFDFLAVNSARFTQLLATNENGVADAFRKDFVGHRFFSEPEAQSRAVFFRATAGLVMHVELDVHARQDAFGRSRKVLLETFARRLTDQLESPGSGEGILAQEDLARRAFAQTSSLARRLTVEPSGGRAVGADGFAVNDLGSFGQIDDVGD